MSATLQQLGPRTSQFLASLQIEQGRIVTEVGDVMTDSFSTVEKGRLLIRVIMQRQQPNEQPLLDNDDVRLIERKMEQRGFLGTQSDLFQRIASGANLSFLGPASGIGLRPCALPDCQMARLQIPHPTVFRYGKPLSRVLLTVQDLFDGVDYLVQKDDLGVEHATALFAIGLNQQRMILDDAVLERAKGRMRPQQWLQILRQHRLLVERRLLVTFGDLGGMDPLGLFSGEGGPFSDLFDTLRRQNGR